MTAERGAKPTPGVMRAAVVEAPGRVSTAAARIPAPGPGEVRVRLEGCGVCGSNLPVWEGRPWFTYPLEPGALGHEGWGEVDAVGDGVDSIAVGARVALLSTHAYAEYDVAPAGAVVALPEALAGRAVPAEPLGCAWNVFRRAGVEAGQTVAVVGVGFLGAVVVQLAAAAGARVLAVSRRTTSLEVARRCGAAETLRLDDRAAVVARVADLTGGALCDRVVEAVGLQEPLDLAGELTRERGRLVVAGYHQDGPRTVDMQLWNWRGIDVVNAHERDTRVYVDGMREALAAAADGRVDLDALVTHTYPLERLGDAFEAMRTRPDGFLKAVVTT